MILELIDNLQSQIDILAEDIQDKQNQITIANWVANLFILGLGTLFLGVGLFFIALIVATVWGKQ